MMNEISDYKTLYSELYVALEQATENEFQYMEAIVIGDYNPETQRKVTTLIHVGQLELKEYMQQFLSLLNIEPPSSILGKRVNNFADATFVISSCRIQIISRLEQQRNPDHLAIITKIINCCMELCSITNMLDEMQQLALPATIS